MILQWASQVAPVVKNLPLQILPMQETWVLSLGQKDPLEKAMAIPSSIPLQILHALQRVEHGNRLMMEHSGEQSWGLPLPPGCRRHMIFFSLYVLQYVWKICALLELYNSIGEWKKPLSQCPKEEMRDYAQIWLKYKEKAGHLTSGKVVTRSGLQSLTVDRALSSSLLKRKTGWGFSSTQKEAYYRAEYRPSIGLKGDCSHEIKRRLLLGRKVMTNNFLIWQHIKKQRHYFVNKGPASQGYGFSCGHVWMWELDCAESWVPKNWCF